MLITEYEVIELHVEHIEITPLRDDLADLVHRIECQALRIAAFAASVRS
jgi:hypothetical protein